MSMAFLVLTWNVRLQETKYAAHRTRCGLGMTVGGAVAVEVINYVLASFLWFAVEGDWSTPSTLWGSCILLFCPGGCGGHVLVNGRNMTDILSQYPPLESSESSSLDFVFGRTQPQTWTGATVKFKTGSLS